ncbi:hypothetical protein BDZ45DRAFT_700115 [Acephala macrosclerotiorum]|nr:hypothetical protein BDZ45DRAFT_700115 [Acephala macrosclerotiorum]
MANHFFWNAGNNPMQMSQVGLLRSLLYQVLRQVPELIVHRLANQTLVPAKICLFVDGFDEYNGDQAKICQLFKNTAASKTMKCCISSRPLNVFENAFRGDEERKLMLQDLARHDMQIYVYDKLGEDHRFRALALKDKRWKDLIQRIVDKAEGVFLWVHLVVQSLLHGLEDDNDIPDMQERVDILPSDLEKYSKHMLGEIDQIYLHTKSPLAPMTFTFMELERNDPDYAIKPKPESPPRESLEAMREKMKYINARSRGLLEINVDRD